MPQTLLNISDLDDFPEVQRLNVRNLTRCWIQGWWHMDVGLRDEGYSDFQVNLVAGVFKRCMDENTAELGKALARIYEKLQWMNYGGTYANRKCQVWWEGDNLLFDIMPGH